jgi:hypothetical protein
MPVILRLTPLLFLLASWGCYTSVEMQTPNITKPLPGKPYDCASEKSTAKLEVTDRQFIGPGFGKNFYSGSSEDSEFELLKRDPTDAQYSAVREVNFSSKIFYIFWLGYHATSLQFVVDDCTELAKAAPVKPERKAGGKKEGK